MGEKKGDFRYAVGESKVPWHAVGEYFNGKDALELVKFLLPKSDNPEYDKALENVGDAIVNLANVSGRAATARLNISGAGDIDASGLQCPAIDSKVHGIGRIKKH